MIRFKDLPNTLFVCALLFGAPVVTLSGCLSLAAQNIVRVDAGITEVFEMSEIGTGSIQKWELPERRSISRIEVHFDEAEPLRNIKVHARMGEGNWKVVKALTTPVRKSPYTVRTAVSTDAIRILLSSSTGTIHGITLYGPAPDESP